MRKITKFMALLLCAALITGALSACGSSASSDSSAASESADSSDAGTQEEASEETTLGLTPLAERTQLSIGFFAGSAHSAPWYIADQMGFFDELNIDVEYQSFTGGPAMMEASADWDICDVGGPGVINGMKNYDINLIGICDNEYNTALFVREDSQLAETPEDPEAWRGTTVLLNKGTTLQYMFMQYMESIGISDLDAYDIEIIDSAVGTCLTAFESGEGDALCVWNAFAVSAENDGYVRIADIETLGLNNISGICATADAIENKTELITLAYQVYYLTWEWCNESEDNMAQAQALFLESCEDEGVSADEDTVERLLEEFQCQTLADAVSAMTTEEEDRNGSGEVVTVATNQLFETLDFFIELGNYTEEDRAEFLEKGLINASVAQTVADGTE